MPKKVLLKLSGEFFQHDTNAIATESLKAVAKNILTLQQAGMRVAVVVGAGNLVRGRHFVADGYDMPTVHYAGMLSAVVNGVMLKAALEQQGASARVVSTFDIPQVTEPHNPSKNKNAYEAGEVLIAGGSGRPFVTTDTGAVLFALELGADVLLKATHVDGVYDSDPRTNASAQKYTSITYRQALAENLQVMDGAALALAQEHGLEMVVCRWEQAALAQFAAGEAVGTRVYTENK